MRKRENIASYSDDELAAMRARGEDLTDWAKVDAMSESELDAAIADDFDWSGIPSDWYENAEPGLPAGVIPRKEVALRLDRDVLAHFEREGGDWQNRINAVLRAFVRAAQHRQPGDGR